MNYEQNQSQRKGSPDVDASTIPERARKKVSLGDLLQNARAEASLSIRQAAEQSGISKGAISRIEQSKILKPSLDTLLGLAGAYGADPMQLIEAAGYKIKKPPLPDFQPYLRQKYRHLPKDATDELADAFQRITEKYGVSHAGPSDGEDEDEPTPQRHHPGDHDSGD